MGSQSRVGNGGKFGSRVIGVALMATTAVAMVMPARLAFAQTTARQTSFNVPAGPLATALTMFGRQAGLQITYIPEIASGKGSPGVSGSVAPNEALARILQGTGLAYSFSNSSTVRISDPSVAGGTVSADGSLVLDTIDVEGRISSVGVVPLDASTGSKIDTPLIEIPQTVNVVTREQLDTQKPETVMQAISYTPGVNAGYIGPATMGDDSYVTIRGWQARQFLDGQRMGGNITGTFSSIDPYLLESIGVLKGPSSTLYGTGTPGGLVDIQSKMPTADPLREIQVQTGSYGRTQGAFDLGGPIDPEGQFLYRLTGIARTGGTQFGHDTKDERIAIAPAITWQPTDDTKLTVLAKYQYNPNMTGFQYLPALGTVLPNPNGPISSRLYGGDSTQDDSWLQQAQIGYEFEHRFNDVWQVKQNLRYEHTKSQHWFTYVWGLDDSDPSMQTASRWSTNRFSDFNRFNVDNQAIATFATGSLDHTMVFGVDYQRYSIDQSGGIGSASPLNLYFPIYNGANSPEETVSSYQTLWQAGAYVQDQIKYDGWNLTLGGRYDWSGSKTTDRKAVPQTTTEQDDEAFSGRVGLSYEFASGLAPYVSYSTSFEPIAGATYDSTPFQPTTGTQLEAGVKFKPVDYNAFIQASVFEIRQQNLVTGDPVNPGYAIQTGEIRSRGFELEAKASLTDSLNVLVGYAYTDAKVTKDNNPDAIGLRPVNAPMHTASAWLDYTFQSGPLEGLMIGGGVRYIGKTYATPENVWTWGVNEYSGQPSTVPGYTLVDAALRYDFSKKFPELDGLTLTVNATNLFNKDHIAGCASAWTCFYGTGRTVYGTLSYKF